MLKEIKWKISFIKKLMELWKNNYCIFKNYVLNNKGNYKNTKIKKAEKTIISKKWRKKLTPKINWWKKKLRLTKICIRNKLRNSSWVKNYRKSRFRVWNILLTNSISRFLYNNSNNKIKTRKRNLIKMHISRIRHNTKK